MAARCLKGANPELEELRLKALSTHENNLDEDVDTIYQSTKRIHAAFLFHSPKTLQPLLRAIAESNSSLESGWQMFGDKLGLDISMLKVINNNQFNHEDPVYNTLLHYVQYEDATIGNVVKALQKMGRYDVINRTKDVMLQLADVILEHERELMRSSHPSSGYGSLESNVSSEDVVEVSHDILIKPSKVPDAPFIIKDVHATPLLSTLLLENAVATHTNVICSPTFSQALERNTFQQSSPVAPRSEPAVIIDSPPAKSAPKQKCARKVMLTFAQDGAYIAAEIARIMRKQRDAGRIGVLILGEQMRHLQNDPNFFISASVQGVDYVIPILTEGYLKSVLRKSNVEPWDQSCVDALYVNFIYQTLVQDYTRRGCLNEKVRCLIPDDNIEKIFNHLIMAGPLFAAWEKLSQTERLAERILQSNA